jgi:hypothetical protein
MATKEKSAVIAVPELSFHEAKDLLKECIRLHFEGHRNTQALIVGSSACGKTSCVKEASFEMDCEYEADHPAFNDPTDVKGLPWPDRSGDKAGHVPFALYKKLIDATKPIVFCIDDLGQGTAAVQASYMPLLFDRKIGNHKISDQVVIFATTNKKTDRAGVSGLLEPVKSRFGTIFNLGIDGNEWIQWAIKNDCDPSVIAYHKFWEGKGGDWSHLYKFVATADMTNSPNYRGWASVGLNLMKMNLPGRTRRIAIAGAIGSEESTNFMDYLETVNKIPSIDSILRDGKNGQVPDEPGILFATVCALVYRVLPKQMQHFADYVLKLNDAGRAEFAAVMMKDIQHRSDAHSLINNTHFQKIYMSLSHLIG